LTQLFQNEPLHNSQLNPALHQEITVQLLTALQSSYLHSAFPKGITAQFPSQSSYIPGNHHPAHQSSSGMATLTRFLKIYSPQTIQLNKAPHQEITTHLITVSQAIHSHPALPRAIQPTTCCSTQLHTRKSRSDHHRSTVNPASN